MTCIKILNYFTQKTIKLNNWAWSKLFHEKKCKFIFIFKCWKHVRDGDKNFDKKNFSNNFPPFLEDGDRPDCLSLHIKTAPVLDDSKRSELILQVFWTNSFNGNKKMYLEDFLSNKMIFNYINIQGFHQKLLTKCKSKVLTRFLQLIKISIEFFFPQLLQKVHYCFSHVSNLDFF